VLGPDGILASLTEYGYDAATLVNTPGVVGHSDISNPYAPKYWVPPDDYIECDTGNNFARTSEASSSPRAEGCHRVHQPGYWQTDYDQNSNHRRNVTQITRYADAVQPAGAVVESCTYDISGNVVVRNGACCEQTTATYTIATQFAYPEFINRGAPPPSSTEITTAATYDFNTGLQTSSTDANGRQTTFVYDPLSLRLRQTTLPTSATVTDDYDDVAIRASAVRSAAYNQGH